MENVQSLVNSLETLLRQQKSQKQVLDKMEKRQKRIMHGQRVQLDRSQTIDHDFDDDDDDTDDDDEEFDWSDSDDSDA